MVERVPLTAPVERFADTLGHDMYTEGRQYRLRSHNRFARKIECRDGIPAHIEATIQL